MCARRFLLVIFVLTLIVVAAAFAIFQFGGSVLRSQMTPQGHFQAPARQSGPDYSLADNWLARPGSEGDSEWLPPGVEPAATRPAAVFYIHPTTYLDRDRWNAGEHPGGDAEYRIQLFLRSQASVFTSVGEVWAPRYRQAAFGAFLLKSEDAQKALDLAYSDVARAFDRFVAEVPAGRPIILAGHSQGALHLSRLLREKVAGKPIARRVVAAYVVGWPLSATADLPAMGLPACAGPDDARCVMSWLTFGEPANPDLILDAYSGTKGPTGIERKRADLVCTNPVSGTLGGKADPALNPGTLVPDAAFATATLLPGLVGGECDKGFLIVNGKLPAIGPYVLPGNNYHVYDYALFWGAIRRDAERRLAAWRH
ncbi:DUF3089 domain-containing protein [Sphingomonas ginkgonis]|uniref:DUF3089 domain-containing protein n=1 Tax=Sphingomonas ginkgonis TaxID=2315330 RepID=A0A429VB55_9SPHN|nr:DUF3089 domain-containing protein [Sphingomonas ginkgonis]RST31175.1 DUF3089 domain-containing protein [Sphingomonas ginkgonis]